MSPLTTVTVRGLNRIHRCRGCGGWRYRYRDLRPCVTCVIAGHRKAIRRLKADQ